MPLSRQPVTAADAAHAMEDAAYQAIITGWEIFPCRGKAPAIPKDEGGNGYLDATTDDRQIREWWTKYPRANIGGRPAEWMIVIDIDPRAGGSLQKLIDTVGPITPTLRSFSGRGDGGMHLFYDRGDLGEIDRRRARALGIDIKAHDGYVILPPSIHPDSRKPYRWDEPLRPIAPLPDGLRRLLTPQPPTSPTHTTTPSVGKLAGLLRTVAEAKVNNRNNLLYWAGCRAAEACYGQGVWDALAEAARATGLSDREIWNAIRSAQSTGGAAA